LRDKQNLLENDRNVHEPKVDPVFYSNTNPAVLREIIEAIIKVIEKTFDAKNVNTTSTTFYKE
jgi:hypothetical protein